MNRGTNIGFPLAIAANGRTALAPTPRHINDMIEELIFTNPGERVNRPDFGGGMYQVIFAPNSVELQATVHFSLLAALQQYLGDLIEVVSLDIEIIEETFALLIAYRILRTSEHQMARFGPFGP
jgi:Bacteriophage baseplate protein W